MPRYALALLAVLPLAACTPKLDRAEVKQMLLSQPRGLIGGIEFGDSWEKIKAEHDPRYTVRDEKTTIGGFKESFLQLRHDLGGPDNGYFLTFQVDEQNNVKSYGASVYGRKENAIVVRDVFDDLTAQFDAKVGKGVCSKVGNKGDSTGCDWKGPAAHVNLLYMEFKDPISGRINVTVSKPH